MSNRYNTLENLSIIFLAQKLASGKGPDITMIRLYKAFLELFMVSYCTFVVKQTQRELIEGWSCTSYWIGSPNATSCNTAARQYVLGVIFRWSSVSDAFLRPKDNPVWIEYLVISGKLSSFIKANEKLKQTITQSGAKTLHHKGRRKIHPPDHTLRRLMFWWYWYALPVQPISLGASAVIKPALVSFYPFREKIISKGCWTNYW